MIRPALEQGLAEMDIDLSAECLRSFELFADELKKWNRKINLTAISNDEDIAVKHIIDSLIFAATVHDGECVLDIGSGAGIPAIPLKIARPSVRVVSVDAVGKKINFQRHAARQLALTNFEALHARVEQLHVTHAGCFDVIVSRAFSNLKLFVILSAPLLKKGGRIIAMKGRHVQDEVVQAAAELQSLGFNISPVDTYTLPMNKGERSLITITAVNAYY